MMNIAILKQPREFAIAEQPMPQIAADEVLLRVAYCGVCTSELDVWDGTAGSQSYPRTLGHEVSGIVEQVGAQVSSVRLGDRVAVWAPGRGYAEYVAVKAEYCFGSGDVPLELALAEPLACAVNAVELAAPALADDVLIIGAGFMGNLVQKLVQLRGPRQLIVADTRPDALERAARLGATHTVDVGQQGLREAVYELTGGHGADLTFEVTGAQAALPAAGEATRMSGKLAIVGYHQGAPREIPLGQWNWMAFQIINAHFRELATIMRGMRIGMRLLTAGRLQLDGLVSHRFALNEINAAFKTAHDKPVGFVKATIQIEN